MQDTFLVAATKLAMLRDPERLRAWLFAVARNECLHRLKSRQATVPVPDIPEQPDESADTSGAAERAEARALIRAAMDGLNASERDIMLQFWHGLDAAEVAAVLGVSRNHVHALFARARGQLKASVSVLMVGWSGRGDCAVLNDLLRDWDGRLTIALRKRVARHIDRCTTCSSRRQRELRDAGPFAMTPAAMLSLAAAGNVPGIPPMPAGPLAWLRDQVPWPAASHQPAAVSAAHAAAKPGTRAFGANGFPKALHTSRLPLSHIPHLRLGIAGGTTVAATTAVVATAVLPSGHGSQPPARHVAPTAPRSARQSPPAAGTLTPIVQTPRSSATAMRASTATPRPTSPVSAGTPASGPAGSPATGTLSALPAAVTVNPAHGGSLTLTAKGGPVSWSISEPPSSTGSLTVSPSSGTLLATGDTVTVRLTIISRPPSHDTTLTVNPGAQRVTVSLGS